MEEIKKNTLVTGGAGFIGSHLVELLLQLGHKVIVLDNCSTGRRENIAHLTDNPNLSFVEIDICQSKEISLFFTGIDWVFHLAAVADIVPSIENPVEYFRSNVDGTLSVLEAARVAGVEKLLYSASSSCYGIPDNYPTKESSAIQPQYPYALTKYLGEQMVQHWGKVYKLPYISLRLFNVYGPRSRTSGTYGAVFGVFLAQKLSGKPYTVVGDGKQTRDFTYVTDVANAFITAAESLITGEIFNVGSGDTYSVNFLVEQLGGNFEYIPKRPGEPNCTFANINKIKNKLQWEAKVPFTKGVKLMLDNIDYWKQAPVWDAQSIDSATKTWFKYLSA